MYENYSEVHAETTGQQNSAGGEQIEMTWFLEGFLGLHRDHNVLVSTFPLKRKLCIHLELRGPQLHRPGPTEITPKRAPLGGPAAAQATGHRSSGSPPGPGAPSPHGSPSPAGIGAAARGGLPLSEPGRGPPAAYLGRKRAPAHCPPGGQRGGTGPPPRGGPTAGGRSRRRRPGPGSPEDRACRPPPPGRGGASLPQPVSRGEAALAAPGPRGTLGGVPGLGRPPWPGAHSGAPPDPCSRCGRAQCPGRKSPPCTARCPLPKNSPRPRGHHFVARRPRARKSAAVSAPRGR